MLFKLTSSLALVKCTMYMCGDTMNPIIDPMLWCQTNLDYSYHIEDCGGWWLSRDGYSYTEDFKKPQKQLSGGHLPRTMHTQKLLLKTNFKLTPD